MNEWENIYLIDHAAAALAFVESGPSTSLLSTSISMLLSLSTAQPCKSFPSQDFTVFMLTFLDLYSLTLPCCFLFSMVVSRIVSLALLNQVGVAFFVRLRVLNSYDLQ